MGEKTTDDRLSRSRSNDNGSSSRKGSGRGQTLRQKPHYTVMEPSEVRRANCRLRKGKKTSIDHNLHRGTGQGGAFLWKSKTIRRFEYSGEAGGTVAGGIQLWRGDRLVSCKRTLLSIGRTAPSSGRRNPSRVNSTRKIRIGQKWQRWHRRSGGDEKRRATANPEWI